MLMSSVAFIFIRSLLTESAYNWRGFPNDLFSFSFSTGYNAIVDFSIVSYQYLSKVSLCSPHANLPHSTILLFYYLETYVYSTCCIILISHHSFSFFESSRSHVVYWSIYFFFIFPFQNLAVLFYLLLC